MTQSPSRLPVRRSLRLHGYDYASNGAYVITVCTHARAHLFGLIADGPVHLSPVGQIVEREWLKTEDLRPGVLLDEFIIMPNHFHGIVLLDLPKDVRPGGGREVQSAAPSGGLQAIVRGFKAGVTAAVRRELHGSVEQVWQRGYHDRIIRNEAELDQFRRYIVNNPRQWELDRYFAAGGT